MGGPGKFFEMMVNHTRLIVRILMTVSVLFVLKSFIRDFLVLKSLALGDRAFKTCMLRQLWLSVFYVTIINVAGLVMAITFIQM